MVFELTGSTENFQTKQLTDNYELGATVTVVSHTEQSFLPQFISVWSLGGSV